MNARAIKSAALGLMALGINLTTAEAMPIDDAASADTFGSGDNAFTINFVDIRNAGNRDDAGAGGGLYSSPYGGVSYRYRMGVTEVPQDWITKATNLGMTNVTAGAWSGLQPAAAMTWYEAAAFVNWLNTSTGHQAPYQLNASNTILTLWSSAHAWQLGGQNLYRHKDAYYFLPSLDEWYKAAYHRNDGVTANYWDYAGSNFAPQRVVSGTKGGTAVYNLIFDVRSGPATVDNNGGLSAYGTRGQNGNVAEWYESASDERNTSPGEDRAFGGGFWLNDESELRSSAVGAAPPGFSTNSFGFRVASVPEPSCAMLMLSGSLLALARRRRRTAANWRSSTDVKRSLLNVRLAGIALLGFAGVSSVQGVILEPTVEATIADGPGLWPPKDGIPDYVMLRTSVQTLHASGHLEHRGVIEFSLSNLPSIETAYLDVRPVVGGGPNPFGGPYPFILNLYGYSGDGVASLADWNSGSLITSFVFGGERSFRVDVPHFISQLRDANATFAGFRFEYANPGPFILNGPFFALHSHETSVTLGFGGDPLRLVINDMQNVPPHAFVPESLPTWVFGLVVAVIAAVKWRMSLKAQ